MITYHESKFQFFTALFRIHGSPLYRAIIPALFSSVILIILERISDEPSAELARRWFQHPYPITCMMVAFTFLLTFKCSFSYNRYWEACTAIHQMQSKWLDVGMELAAFHLQSERFAQIRPPAFGQHPQIDHVLRKRERQYPMTPMKLQQILRVQEQESSDDDETDLPFDNENNNISLPVVQNESFGQRGIRHSSSSLHGKKFKSIFGLKRRKKKSTSQNVRASFMNPQGFDNQNNTFTFKSPSIRSINNKCDNDESNSLAAGVFNKSSSFKTPTCSAGRNERPSSLTKLSSVPDLNGGMSNQAGPSLFLQEASHLLSLLSAVAFATLRNDIETAESPLHDYIPGSPWPPVDPDAEDAGEYNEFYKSSQIATSLRYMIGFVRTPAQRTVYNACRPFKVLGGVSDAEIDVLQRARGPLAKTALCTMWLQEFISREFLNGSLGKVSPPIVSRLFQYTSDGMIGYNQARKVAYVPFPFPHSQLTTFFLVVVTCFMPILMLTFVSEVIVATILNTMTVGVFVGLWMVANELEDPFRNVPNDIPLNHFQAQFNEALVCMFAGFHPEAWWDIDERKESLSNSEELQIPTIKSLSTSTEVTIDSSNTKSSSNPSPTLESINEAEELKTAQAPMKDEK